MPTSSGEIDRASRRWLTIGGKTVKEKFAMRLSERKYKSRRDLPNRLTSAVRFHSIVVRSARSFPILSGLFIGRPNCTSWNEISGKRIGWGMRGRDRKGPGRKGVETEELHTWFPPSPWSETFRAMRRARTSARPLRGSASARYLADKVAQSCVHYEIREAEEYERAEKVELRIRQGGPRDLI